VDCGAKLSSLIIFNDNAEIGLYNIVGSFPLTSDELLKVTSQCGLKLTILEEKEFAEQFFANENSLISIFKEGYGDKAANEFLGGVNPVFKNARKGKGNILRPSRKLSAVIPNIDDIIPHPSETHKRMIDFAKREGLFQKLDIEYF
jgi:hypothetical protein